MRILHIVGTISPVAGGPTEVIKALVRHAPAGYESEIATLDDPAAPFLSELPCPTHALGSAKKSWYVPAFAQWLKANRHRFDGVIVHGLWEYTALAARQTLKGHVPYVIFPHGMLDPWFKHAYPKKHLKKWAYWLLAEYWNLRSAYRVLFTTEAEAQLAQQSFELWSWKPMVVAIGAEAPPPINREVLTEAFYERCPQLRDERFLLFLGRIHPKKGCDMLLNAFTAFDPIAMNDPELHIAMVGPDSEGWSRQLRERIVTSNFVSRVHWPGMLTGDAKWGAFAACEAFILPSHQENFGVAVVEALASGKPVLLSNQINIAGEIAADGCGYVEPDTLVGTRSLLQRWIATTPAEREKMSAQARQTFAARYDMRRNAETILRVFEQAPAAHTASTPLPEAR